MVLSRTMTFTPRSFARCAALASAVTVSFAVVIGAIVQSPALGTTKTETAVEVRDYNFRPQEIAATAGGTIMFHNVGTATHRIVADDGSFDSRGLQPGGSASMGTPNVGSVRIHCEIHPSMTANIVIVQALSGNTQAPATTAASTSAATTKPPLPTSLAATGAAANFLVGIAAACLIAGTLALGAHRKFRLELALAPSETAWRSVTIAQRHHDDILATPQPQRLRR